MKSLYRDLLPSLEKALPDFSPGQIEKALHFGELLNRENQSQNLTRIEGPSDFVDGHLQDVVELFRFEQAVPDLLGNCVADLGSGSGVPGLLAAAMDLNPIREWVLIESERNKAEYLTQAARELGLNRVKVVADRAENVVSKVRPTSVMARAVGPVDKIAAWIWNCSTWNNLVLFKSRGWKDEWERAKVTKTGKKLTVIQAHEYSVKEKYRVLIQLGRQ